MSRYIVKKEFDFYVYDSHMPTKVKEGSLVSYEVYTHEPGLGCNNAIKITIHGPDGDITFDGPNKIYLKDYLREIEYSDLVHLEECISEQQKDRTYRHSVTKNYCFVDNLSQVIEDGRNEQNETNYNKCIAVATVLNYFHKITVSEDSMDKHPTDKHVIDWISSEIEKLEKEYNRLKILAASDEDIIQTALIEYGNQERYDNDVEIANKITDVRNRYLEMLKERVGIND